MSYSLAPHSLEVNKHLPVAPGSRLKSIHIPPSRQVVAQSPQWEWPPRDQHTILVSSWREERGWSQDQRGCGQEVGGWSHEESKWSGEVEEMEETVKMMLAAVSVPCSDTWGRFCPQAASLCMGPLCCCRHDDEAHKCHSPINELRSINEHTAGSWLDALCVYMYECVHACGVIQEGEMSQDSITPQPTQTPTPQPKFPLSPPPLKHGICKHTLPYFALSSRTRSSVAKFYWQTFFA